MTADAAPWIVYYPEGHEILARRFLAELQFGDETRPDAVARMMLKLNATVDCRIFSDAGHDLWAFGRLDTPDFTHVLTRGHARSLFIYWFLIWGKY